MTLTQTSSETSFTPLESGGEQFDNRQPYTTTTYAIATHGDFPARSMSTSPLIGGIGQFAGNFAPRGWEICKGQLLAISQNQDLFAILGTTYGGNGTTTFALPDLRGRTPVGIGQGTGLSEVSLGEKLGTEFLELSQPAAHAHSINETSNTENSGISLSLNNMMPGLGLIPLISIDGLFPARNLSSEPYLGSISWFAGNFVPRGWAQADGSLLQISENTDLYGLIGTTFGGDGFTTFALPDLRGRIAVQARIDSGINPVKLGEQGGSEELIPQASQMPEHSHQIDEGATGSSGTGQEFSNMQPYLGLNFEIALDGIYPPRSLNGKESEANHKVADQKIINEQNHNKPAGRDSKSGEKLEAEAIQHIAGIGAKRWKQTGVSANKLKKLKAVDYQVVNLAPGQLAEVSNATTISIDVDGSGRGWFVDTTPKDDLEFASTDQLTGELSATNQATKGKYDLLTAIMHEQGHILGLAHDDHQRSIMHGGISTGTRKYPTSSDVVNSSKNSINFEHNQESVLLNVGDTFIGAIGITASSFARTGHAICTGEDLPIEENKSLFSILGKTYGGDGQSTFSLPDMTGRTPIGFGMASNNITNYSLGSNGGDASINLDISNLPSHDHSYTPESGPAPEGNEPPGPDVEESPNPDTDPEMIAIPVVDETDKDSDDSAGNSDQPSRLKITVNGIDIEYDNPDSSSSDSGSGETPAPEDIGVILFGNNQRNTIKGTARSDELHGKGAADRLIGKAGNDALYGNGGADTLLGKNGNDRLYGGKGKDSIKAGQGDDMIVGGPGRNKLHGNQGKDTFAFTETNGKQIIKDFNPDEDNLYFAHGFSSASFDPDLIEFNGNRIHYNEKVIGKLFIPEGL